MDVESELKLSLLFPFTFSLILLFALLQLSPENRGDLTHHGVEFRELRIVGHLSSFSTAAIKSFVST
jgi:hypothetical protein